MKCMTRFGLCVLCLLFCIFCGGLVICTTAISSGWSISDCPCIGQTFDQEMWAYKIWHDCDEDGKADLICWYLWPKDKNGEIITLHCEVPDD